MLQRCLSQCADASVDRNGCPRRGSTHIWVIVVSVSETESPQEHFWNDRAPDAPQVVSSAALARASSHDALAVSSALNGITILGMLTPSTPRKRPS